PAPSTLLTDPSFSPDGQRIAFNGFDADFDARVYVADASGSLPGIPIAVTDDIPGGADWANPEWSSDGRRLLLAADFEDDGTSELHVVDLENEQPHQVEVSGDMIDGGTVFDAPVMAPEFTADGKAVLFVANADDLMRED